MSYCTTLLSALYLNWHKVEIAVRRGVTTVKGGDLIHFLDSFQVTTDLGVGVERRRRNAIQNATLDPKCQLKETQISNANLLTHKPTRRVLLNGIL
jgi:hypothetical protein